MARQPARLAERTEAFPADRIFLSVIAFAL